MDIPWLFIFKMWWVFLVFFELNFDKKWFIEITLIDFKITENKMYLILKSFIAYISFLKNVTFSSQNTFFKSSDFFGNKFIFLFFTWKYILFFTNHFGKNEKNNNLWI